MINIEYNAKVLSDGHLSCPENIKRKLHLSNGSEIKVILLRLTEPTKECNNSKKEASFAELPVCGIWADREDMKESTEWVNRLRAGVNDRQRRLGFE